MIEIIKVGSEKERDLVEKRVRDILRDLGHQLEEEIAERNIWLQTTHRLQGVKTVFNATDRRKLSEARVLDGAELIKLRDARLVKDAKAVHDKLKKSLTKVATGFRKGRRRVKPARVIAVSSSMTTRTISGQTCQPASVGMEEEEGSETSLDEITEEDWDSTEPDFDHRRQPLFSHDPPVRTYRAPDQPLHMSLRSRK
jgi:hypothetical protein